MPRITYFIYILSLIVLNAFLSCKNKHPDQTKTGVDLFPAFKNLNDSIREYPSGDSLYLRRAIRLSQQNEHELANADFLKAWAIDSSLDNGLALAGNLGIIGKQRDKTNLLESLYSRYPDNAQVGRLLAESYASNGKNSAALAMYNALVKKDSLDSENWYEKALLLEQMKDTIHAMEALQKAYSIQGVDTYGLELANLYAEQKNPKALSICDFIIRHDSAQVLIDPYFIKGIFYSNSKQYKKAIGQFDSCILKDWKTTDAYLEKGRVYYQMGNFDAAMNTFNMAVTVSNTDPDAYFWLGRSYEAMNRRTEALACYQKTLSLDKSFVEARTRIETLNSEFAHPSH